MVPSKWLLTSIFFSTLLSGEAQGDGDVIVFELTDDGLGGAPTNLQGSLHHAWSTRIKDASIAIRHSRGGIPFYTAGSRNGLERLASGAR